MPGCGRGRLPWLATRDPSARRSSAPSPSEPCTHVVDDPTPAYNGAGCGIITTDHPPSFAGHLAHHLPATSDNTVDRPVMRRVTVPCAPGRGAVLGPRRAESVVQLGRATTAATGRGGSAGSTARSHRDVHDSRPSYGRFDRSRRMSRRATGAGRVGRGGVARSSHDRFSVQLSGHRTRADHPSG